MRINEYTIVELEGVGKSYYSIRIDDGLYYVSYDRDEIQATNDIGFAKRIVDRESAEGEVKLLQRFYDENGQRKLTNALEEVTTVKGYSLETGIGIRTVQRMCEDGRLKAKNVFGVWLIDKSGE
ncbi:hypothetical protein D3C75_427330 [compost metagenome]